MPHEKVDGNGMAHPCPSNPQTSIDDETPESALNFILVVCVIDILLDLHVRGDQEFLGSLVFRMQSPKELAFVFLDLLS